MVLFISDTHIGSPLYTNYGPLLDVVSDPKYDMIVVCGDLIDVQENNLEDIMSSENAILCRKLKEASTTKSVIIIKGNHDPDVLWLKEYFCDATVLEVFKMGELIAIHGSEFDHSLKDFSWLNKILFCFQWVLERLGFDAQSFFRDRLHSIAAYIKHKSYNDIVSNIEQEAFDIYSQDYNYIVMGHLHQPKIVNVNDTEKQYVNVGDQTHNKTYVVYNGTEFILSSSSTFTLINGS